MRNRQPRRVSCVIFCLVAMLAAVISVGFAGTYAPPPAQAAYRICKSISASGAHARKIHAHKAALARLTHTRRTHERGGYRSASEISRPLFRRAGGSWVATVSQRLCKQRQ